MSIFQFGNYADFLRFYVRSQPRGGYGVLSKIAEHLSMNSTLLSQILAGTRAFTTDQACELASYLQLTDLETDYLYVLVEIERAGTQKNKAYLKKRLEQIKNEAQKVSKRIRLEKSLNDAERAIFYSSWLYPAVHLFCDLNTEGMTIEEICQRFDMSRQKISEMMSFFLQTGLCREKGGRFRTEVLSTFVEQGSPYLLKHHANWRIKSIQKSESISNQELMFTSPVSISLKDFEKIREMLVQFIKESSLIIKDSPAEDLANLNIDWYWIGK